MVSTTIRYRIRRAIIVIVIIVSIFAMSLVAGDDSVLDFYCSSAGAEFSGRNPLAHGAVFSFRAISRLSAIGNGGVAMLKDSLVRDYFYSFGQEDSSHIVVASAEQLPRFEFEAPNIFGNSFDHSFVPNDTGGPELPIGFDSPTAESDAPNGIAVIDRSTYATKRLYLFFPNKVGYKRLSRVYSFGLHDEFLIPEQIIEQGAVSGIFTTSYYRLETRLTDIRIIRQSGPSNR